MNSRKRSRRDFLVESGQKLAGLSFVSSLVAVPSRGEGSQEVLIKETAVPEASPVVRYDFDPNWPQKPETVGAWAGNPAVMVDGQEQVWVSNRAFPAMMIFDTSGRFIRAWDSDKLFSEKGPTLFQDKEKGPYNLHFFRFDGDHVWVANTNRHVIQKCDRDGNVLLTLGAPDEPGADEKHFNRPTDMTITKAGVFVSDGYGNRRVVHLSAEGKFIKAWGREGRGPDDFIDPHAICHIGDRLYVVDRGNIRIKVYDFNGKLLDIWRDLILPFALIPTGNSEIWTCGFTPIKLEDYSTITGGKIQQNQVAMKFSAEGKILQIYAFPTAVRGTVRVPGKLNVVHGLAVDSRGNLYFGEAFNPGPQKWVRSSRA
jgi:hypothetical protein